MEDSQMDNSTFMPPDKVWDCIFAIQDYLKAHGYAQIIINLDDEIYPHAEFRLRDIREEMTMNGLFSHPVTKWYCGRCKIELEMVAEDHETCWYCRHPICDDCWEEYGHCGHPEADDENEKMREHYDKQE